MPGRRNGSGRRDGLSRPALPYRSQELLLVFLDLPDKRLIFGILMRGSPEHHFREDRCKIESFGGEHVKHFSPVGRVWFCGNDSMGDQFAQAIRQDVCSDALVGFQKFLVGPEAAQHHVADNQQGPAVAEYFYGGIQRTPRAPFWTGLLLWHIFTVAYYHLLFASEIGRLLFRVKRFSAGNCKSGWVENDESQK